ncbi:hypothetical protein HMPREF0185_00316 [Brevundimonas diminuta 470-4]|nr:hypothetical protein HMPREF0185_00316 [Brevundimonas diminuta 470-4]
MMEGLSGAQTERRTVMTPRPIPKAHRTNPPGQILFLVTKPSASFTAAGFCNGFRSACRQAGIGDCLAHGLR